METIQKHVLRLIANDLTIVIMDTSWFRNLFNRAGAALENTQIKADRGDAAAQFSLGLKFASGSGVTLDYPKAVQWYLKAANQNHPLAQFNLGLMYAGGQGVVPDEDKAATWMRMAARQGDAGAQHHLGLKCRRASFEGVPKDAVESNVEAYKWFSLAAAQGYGASDAARDDIAVGLTRAQVADGNHRVKSWVPAPSVPSEAQP
jgi:TPR repeat protein